MIIPKLQVISAKRYQVRLKATIQASGRLGFTGDTGKALHLTEQSSIQLARDPEDDTLYLIVFSDFNEDAFPVKKTGEYFYLPTRMLFEELGYEFQDKTIIFDLVRIKSLDEQMGGQVYKLNRRDIERRNKRKTEERDS